MSKKTAVLLAGFGGPATPSEVRPFIESVAQGAHIPPERLEDVTRHYDQVGGFSRYNAFTERQREALVAFFKKKSLVLPVFVGFMHSHPSFNETFLELQKEGIQKALVFVLSSFRSYPSYEKYHRRLEEARAGVSKDSAGSAWKPAIEMEFASPFYDHPLFIQAVSQRAIEAMKEASIGDLSKTHVIFTAHSIPEDWAENSGYAQEFKKSAWLVAQKLGMGSWSLAYQSRSGPPNYPWLEPDINDAIRGLPKKKGEQVMIVPIGFLCDNVEVLYDLDIAAKKTAEETGLRYARASTVNDHPAFIEMIASLIEQRS